MREILEGVIPYVYFLVSCFIVSSSWCLWTNRRFIKLLFGKHKSTRRFKKKGKEVLYGNVAVWQTQGVFYLYFENNQYKLFDAEIFGKWQLGETKCLMSFKDGLIKTVCFSENNLFNWYHEQLMKHSRIVFLTAIGVNVLWTILSKMLESQPG